ncbi:MAG: hypothetical protein IPP72_10535 [Chitinophagaceae bacterium]|nr:hypothetical protein [Chitinophagaceae bacterium]
MEMTTGAKITLSNKELELVCNTDWILTKHSIIQKVYQLLGDALPELESKLLLNKALLPAEVFMNTAKIARGENYQQLPYVVLDYPRYFGKEDSIAIRTFFWWGNFFSVSLQLSGCFKEQSIHLVEQRFELLQQKGFWLCVNDGPWEHHFNDGNFKALQSITKQEFSAELVRKPFFKMAKKIPLQQWNEIPLFIVETFEELNELLKFN